MILSCQQCGNVHVLIIDTDTKYDLIIFMKYRLHLNLCKDCGHKFVTVIEIPLL